LIGRGRLGVVAALGTAQTLAWGSSYYLPAILADPIARDLGISSNRFFVAFSTSLVISGLLGPRVGRQIDRVGGRQVLCSSNVLLAAGLALLGASTTVWMMSAAAPRQTWNFNFIQMLSEVASSHPELLVLVASVRNGDTESYRQVHRVNPVQIDFKAGGTPDRIQADRRRMLLHRLFSNRRNIDPHAIDKLIGTHFSDFVC